MKQTYTPAFVLDELKSVSDPDRLLGMQRYAIDTEKAIGVSLPDIRSIAKTVGKDHELALALWDTEIHEARIIASMIDDPKLVTKKQMDRWTKVFYSWDLCDQVCNNLFQKTDFFLEKAFEYSHAKSEFVKRTGFVLMVQFAVHHKKGDDALCIQFLERVEAEAWDGRNFVKKALNWCLRQIGKRNAMLHPIALKCAYRIKQQESASAKWIASDAIRELESEAVRSRLGLA